MPLGGGLKLLQWNRIRESISPFIHDQRDHETKKLQPHFQVDSPDIHTNRRPSSARRGVIRQ